MVSDYVDLIENAEPNFLDLKGFTLEGSSMNISKRLGTKEGGDNFFPDFEYLLNFAQKLENESSFKIIETHEKSRDILLRVAWPEDRSIKITTDQI
jgi:wyosine [tRNA(Phe)-imidazoG37] synthetase (radical SAM superfamily)